MVLFLRRCQGDKKSGHPSRAAAVRSRLMIWPSKRWLALWTPTVSYLRLRNPGFRNRTPRVFINRYPPPPPQKKNPPIGKIPTPIKIKLALLPPPSKKAQNPPLKGGILWAWRFSFRKNPKMPGAHKIGAAISGPELWFPIGVAKKNPRFGGGAGSSIFLGGGGPVYAWNRYNVANWRSHRETVHFFGPKLVIFGVLALQK